MDQKEELPIYMQKIGELPSLARELVFNESHGMIFDKTGKAKDMLKAHNWML